MARILDERDRDNIKQEMQIQDNLLKQKIEVLDSDIQQLSQDTAQNIAHLDKKVDDNVASLESEMTSQINTLGQNMNDRVNTLEADMTNKVNTLEQNTNTQIGALEESVSTRFDDLEQDVDSQISNLSQNMTAQINDLEQQTEGQVATINSNISTLRTDMTTQINGLDESTTNKIDSLKSDMATADTQLLSKIDEVNSNVATLESNLTTQIGDLDSEISTQMSALETGKVDKDGDKVLSENDLTDELKSNYDDSYEHSQEAHAPIDAEMNVQANWAEEDNTSDSYIQNKPILGTLAAKSVVEKNDLSEEIQASLTLANTSLQSFDETDPTVPDWAKQPEKPTYTSSEVGALSEETTALKNPNSIIFTGASNASYDGSTEVTVHIPELPIISEADEGKVLCVVNGAYSLVSITDLIPKTEEPVS